MKKLLLTALCMAAMSLCTAQTKTYLDPKAPLEERVKDALSRMTVHEKIQMLHGQSKFTSAGVPRLGIKELHMSDGPHGCRAEVEWNGWNTANWNNDSCVAFPSLTCLASTWNREMSAIYGHAVGEEFAYRDKNIMLGPGVNIARLPFNGRSFEYMGEDPVLAGEMVVPYIQNVQKLGVACCLKHFFVNNQEIGRNSVNVNASERAIREIYLPAFRKGVVEGGTWSIMGSYNRWLNTHCCENDSLLNGILKGEWGFDGAVVSDWGGVHSTMGAALGGMDIEMGTGAGDGVTNRGTKTYTYHTNFLGDNFEKLIVEGKIPMSVLDDKAARVLRTIFRTGMNPDRAIGALCSEEHYNACEQIAEEGIVLMKNDKNLLPLDPSKKQRILVVGENATRSLTEGGGSSELKTKFDISPLEGLRAIYGDQIDYAQGYMSGRAMYAMADRVDNNRQAELKAEALEKAKSADVIIFVGGLNKNGAQDCEGMDRREYQLPFGQPELITELAKIQKNIVVVTFGGNPFETTCLKSVPSFLHCWYLGSMAGQAIAKIISGKVNPSGKLPVTFAADKNDYPCFQYGDRGYPGVDNQVYYDEGIFVGYRYFNTKNVKPAFPFGHGLSYTTFAYGKPTIEAVGKSFKVTIPVKNTGKVAGKEIVQLYVGMNESKIERPQKELKDFAKVSLAPGEEKTVTFTIDDESLQYWDETTHSWQVEHGGYTAYINSSETVNKAKVKFIM